jgi:hypothetical protein
VKRDDISRSLLDELFLGSFIAIATSPIWVTETDLYFICILLKVVEPFIPMNDADLRNVFSTVPIFLYYFFDDFNRWKNPA